MAIDKFRDFKFSGLRLDSFDIPRIGATIGVGEAIIRGVMDTEAAGKSVDKSGRIKALYEPHVAYRTSRGVVRQKLVEQGLAYPKWRKGYPADSYPSIKKAMLIDETVALMATSWGFPQILGENYALAGYETVQKMVLDFLADEDNQLEAMITFIKSSHLDDELLALEKRLRQGRQIPPDAARAFVRGYNGPAYEKNDYHTIFARNVNKWAKVPNATPAKPVKSVKPAKEHDEIMPEAVGDDNLDVGEVAKIDLYDGSEHAEVRAVQQRLSDLGYPEVGKIDGKWGTRTRGVILTFRADNGLPMDGLVDDRLMASLMIATPRYINPARAKATIADLRAEGAPDVKAADTTQIVGAAAGGFGLLGGAGSLVDSAEDYGGLVKRIANLIEPIQSFVSQNLWLLVAAGGLIIVWQSGVLKSIRLVKHQTGSDVSA